MTWLEMGTAEQTLSDKEVTAGILSLLDTLGEKQRVLAIPPDITRFHSRAGEITEAIWHYYGTALTDIIPALGTHIPMTREEQIRMFGDIPEELFRVHDWRRDPVTVGTVPAEFVERVSGGAVDYPVAMEVNRLLLEGGHDLILSVGQVVPHEVIGMANHNKNIFVGVGGAECINKSHFLGAAFGMERIMGRADTPVRRVLNYGSDHFISHLPIVYILTVLAPDAAGIPKVYGLFAGDDEECFRKAAALALEVNFTMLEEAPDRVVVYLDPGEFRSTWLGNKAVYRTRMALADRGELIILAPGLKEFGEDPEIDRLIRKYGYVGREEVLSLVKSEPELQENLSAAAHLIHGSSDGRFSITYCPGELTRKEIEGVNYVYGDLDEMMERYHPSRMKEGWNRTADGEKVYFISNPALGLWAEKARFSEA